VARRAREVGIRVALGATTASVTRMVVGNTLAGVTAGVALGGLTAGLVSRVLAPYLYGVTAHDPVAYVGTFAVLAGVSVAASWLPARRAGRIEPAIVLRAE
jgi:ABC-type antimicrobial peptide transport system permease subunit